ncbi:MAG TPA: ABC transporter ATP-binding protein [Lactobacillus johnsonii]|uniref:ABC transporter ATP-binding protein n=1 Tax=Lactobacillus johnsonii TaxID=33959 RepID=A0A921EJD7_LACJH|nr:ABC transporter ATP-binding protein [Lactobacillus sp. A27]MBM6959046.1 ABC transporter ATP-binding protein [Lactobacillus gallinarum]HJE48596.1 ABC transporter ATP-binding protein [Lactobacillus johnsonii]
MKKGEIAALLGPNGAGKTTIVSIVGGYLLPTSGSVIVGGQNIIKTRLRDNIGVSFGGDLGFYGRATAKQNLSYFADLAKIPYRKQKAEIERVLDLVSLSNDMNKKVQFFSKGMKQRMHIARALLGNPKLLLLDEPTDGLDVEIATNIRNVVKNLAQNDISILLTSHMMSEVEALADQIVLLGAGKVHAKGTVQDIVKLSKVKRIDRPATLEESYLALAPQLRRE